MVIAVKDGQDYLGDALDSVLAQTVPSIEMIVVDDGSTDATADILGRFQDARIRVINNPSSVGQTRSLNIALDAANGRFIARQDADDVWSPGRLAVGLEALRRRKLVIVGSGAIEMDSRGRATRVVRVPEHPVELGWHMLFRNVCHHSSLLWDSSLLPAELCRYDESLEFAQDYDLLARASRRVPVGNVGAPLVCIRRHAAAKGAARAAVQASAAHGISELLLRRYLPHLAASRLDALMCLGAGVPERLDSADMNAAVFDFCHLKQVFLADQTPCPGWPEAQALVEANAAERLAGLVRTHLRSHPRATIAAYSSTWSQDPAVAAAVFMRVGGALADRMRLSLARPLKRTMSRRQEPVRT